MRLLVFGAQGFIGNHFNEMFHAIYEIIPAGSRSHKNKRDFTVYEDVFSVLDEYKPDAVLNLAGTSYHKTRDDAEIYENNILIQLNLHEAINQLKLNTKVILCSSSAVYKSSINPVDESSFCLPLNSYAKAKYIQERVGLSYFPEHDVVIARLFNVIGPYQNNSFFIPTVISRIISYKQHEISEINLKTLNAMRDFIYIRDVCSALGFIIDKGVSGEVYNVCRGEEVSIEKVIEILKAILDIAELPINVQDGYVKEGITYQVGSNSKIKNLGWSPKYDIRESLEEIIRGEYGY